MAILSKEIEASVENAGRMPRQTTWGTLSGFQRSKRKTAGQAARPFCCRHTLLPVSYQD
jgi:hypothetical protein